MDGGTIMRTITENLLHRLAAQAQEAELQGFSKVAESLTEQVEKHGSEVREDDAFYSYSQNDFKKDVNSKLWDTIIRIADFYGIKRFEAEEVQELIEKVSEDLITDFCNKVGIAHQVGAYEEKVPGENFGQVTIEVDEGDM